MCALINRIILIASIWVLNCYLPVEAHVKWFLSRPENELLKEPKPDLFTHLSMENGLPILVAIFLIFTLNRLNKKLSHLLKNKRLIFWTYKYESLINLLMAIGLGVSLIFAGMTRTLLVPNFVICSHCPQWLPPAEITVGLFIVFGLFARLSALTILGFIYMAICKHGIAECLDILPLFGLALYFLFSGRNKFSLDFVCGFNRYKSYTLSSLGHYCVRASMGLGLVVLALSEKLLHPQLAMDLLQHAHALNPLLRFGMSNEMFVLLAGLSELLLGVIIFMGYFPRLAVFLLLGVFAGTTAIFGLEEFIGHAACYSSILSIALCGASVPSFLFAKRGWQHSVSKISGSKLAFADC